MVVAFRSLLAGACLALAVPATAREFRSADIHPTDYPTVEAVRFMGSQLATETGGRLGVKVYPNGALGTEADTIEQLKIGGLDMMPSMSRRSTTWCRRPSCRHSRFCSSLKSICTRS